MSIWVFQDSGQNNYITYINTVEIGLVKTDSVTLNPIWSFQSSISGQKTNINGTVDNSFNIYIAYQDISNTTTYIMKINSSGTSILWQQTIIGVYQPSLSVDTAGLYLSGVSSTSGQVIIYNLSSLSGTIIWTSTLTAGSTPSSVASSQEIAVVQSIPPSGNFIETRLQKTTGAVVRNTNYQQTGQSPICFLQGAPVLLANGTWKRIETILPGDKVWTPYGSRPVVHRIESETRPSILTYPVIIPRGFMGAIHALAISPTHKIRMPDGTYKRAGELMLERLPLKKPWIYYNLQLPEWEPVCIGGLIVESYVAIKYLSLSCNIGCRVLSSLMGEKTLSNVLNLSRKLIISKSHDIINIPLIPKKAEEMYPENLVS